MAKKGVLLILLLSLFFTLFAMDCFAANIHGNIYDINLNTVENAVIEVNSVPTQIYVSKEGTYSFDLKVGSYSINAAYEKDLKKYTAEQNITIVEDGNYVLDFILFPDLSEDDGLIDHDTDLDTIYGSDNKMYFWIIVLLSLVILVMAAFFIFNKYRKKKKKSVEVEGIDAVEEVIKFIEKEDGRTTQKDIRKQFPVSEAKISLIVSELEHKGIIKKIKRGRGNLIVLNKEKKEEKQE
jgi:uncharacterized membrane protein